MPPERQTVQALQIDGSQDHFDAGNDYIELCEQLHATARERHVEMEFAHRVDEVFLQDLRRNHARFRETQIHDAVSLPPLPLRSVRAACWCGSVWRGRTRVQQPVAVACGALRYSSPSGAPPRAAARHVPSRYPDSVRRADCARATPTPDRFHS